MNKKGIGILLIILIALVCICIGLLLTIILWLINFKNPSLRTDIGLNDNFPSSYVTNPLQPFSYTSSLVSVVTERVALKTTQKKTQLEYTTNSSDKFFIYIANDKELYLINSSNTVRSKLTNTGGSIQNFRVSGDKTKVAYITSNMQIFIIDLKSKTQTLIFDKTAEGASKTPFSTRSILGYFNDDGSELLIQYNGPTIIFTNTAEMVHIEDNDCELEDSAFNNIYLWVKQTCGSTNGQSTYYRRTQDRVLTKLSDFGYSDGSNNLGPNGGFRMVIGLVHNYAVISDLSEDPSFTQILMVNLDNYYIKQVHVDVNLTPYMKVIDSTHFIFSSGISNFIINTADGSAIKINDMPSGFISDVLLENSEASFLYGENSTTKLCLHSLISNDNTKIECAEWVDTSDYYTQKEKALWVRI